MNSVVFIALRRLRAPLILLVAVFALGIVGLVLIPGLDAQGRAWHLTVFQALYFMTYTATTIGFGELPREFGQAQRLWVTIVIFLSVVGWAYLVASLLGLARDKAFRGALVEGRFRRRVRALREPFYLICGFGETGLLVGRALDWLGTRFVAIEIDETRAQELELLDLAQDAPALAGDARLPENMLAAGLAKRECRGVLALTNDDHANLAVAMSVRLLNPNIPVLCRAMSPETAANMASFGSDHIVNPFVKFGEYLALAIASPGGYRLTSWLTGLPGTTLKAETAPPRGHWIVCGYGRFGREVVQAFRGAGLDVTVIDPNDAGAPDLRAVRGRGTEAEPLLAAGIDLAAGIVAGTDDDINNLSIAVTARGLNARLFTIVRQNLQANRALFEAYAADITMVSSEIVANECLARLKTPALGRFLEMARGKGDAWADALLERLIDALGAQTPEIWSVAISATGAPALHRALMLEKGKVLLGDLARDSGARERRNACMPLLLTRGGGSLPLPGDEVPLRPGDEVLFAGTPQARRTQWPMLRNVNVRDYVLSGIDLPGGLISLWARRRRREQR
jgi:voltage-gated potassium channel